ncbi:hypothetical protein, partial [Enterococcus faecalis]|uniref:hypothetical protein n=1 Tax=Enterococcus faecalis TaxID=1351 RepID=UPI002FBDB1DC
ATTLIVPDKIEFQDITIDGQEKEVPTKPGFEVKVRDTHVNQQSFNYELSVSVQDTSESLAPYLYYKSRLTTTPLVAGNTKNINYGKFDDEMGEPIE